MADGALVRPGEPLTAGPCDPQELAELGGIAATLEYLVAEVQRVYRANAAAAPSRLDRERPHALDGLLARLAAKVALHTFCLWLNRHLGRPLLAFADLIAW